MTTFGTLEIENGEAIVKDKMEFDLNSLPSSDPMAFGYGISRGQRLVKEAQKNKYIDYDFMKIHGSKFSELAPEYLRGFLFGYKGILVPEGTKIKKGQEACYALFDKNTYKNDIRNKK